MCSARFIRTLFAAVALGGCGEGTETLVVYNAGSLAQPIKAALDSFAAREGVRVAQESAGSLESARKLTELGKIPDVIALADADVFPRYLMPEHIDGYTVFARNRMVVAYTDRSRGAAEITRENWPEILSRPNVEVGRSDPEMDPNGYRTLMVWQLAALARNEPGLIQRLEARAPRRNVRPKEADLIGLLQAGEFDYIWSYESIARNIGLRWVNLGADVDLSDPDAGDQYRRAELSVRGAKAGEQVVFTGAPIAYAYAVPINAPSPELAERFVAFLQSAAGQDVMRSQGLDVLPVPERRP